jgi:hypothetical protein
MREGRASIFDAKAILESSNADQLLRSPRAQHVGTVKVGTWENLKGFVEMQNYEIKKDNFKTSIISFKVVRLTRNSKEVE